jgi:hypothetical protein
MRFSETSVHVRIKRWYIPDEGSIHKCRCQNLKSWVQFYSSLLKPTEHSPTALLVYSKLKIINSVALVREQAILTERPPLVSEVSVNFC